jgi:predicted metal-dependent hydrolase
MIIDNELGKIEFVVNQRSKHIRVRILKSGLRVSLPPESSENDAMDFIQSIRGKLINKQKRITQIEINSNYIIDSDTQIQTLSFKIVTRSKPRKNIHFRFQDACLVIEFPDGLDCDLEQNQKIFWNGIIYFLRKEAKRILPARVHELADIHGFTVSDIKIQSSKSRWGSCSSSKSINLSLYLLLLPAYLIDYVILHELCHTKEMNHSVKFWQWMDKVTLGKSQSLRKELKKYHMPN